MSNPSHVIPKSLRKGVDTSSLGVRHRRGSKTPCLARISIMVPLGWLTQALTRSTYLRELHDKPHSVIPHTP